MSAMFAMRGDRLRLQAHAFRQAALDLERIVALAPDLVVAWPYLPQAQLERLRELGFAIYVSNPHSPEQYRVDGIVRNFDPWYKAFNVQPGDKLYLPPEQRVHIW